MQYWLNIEKYKFQVLANKTKINSSVFKISITKKFIERFQRIL